jgi:hypothetical protein
MHVAEASKSIVGGGQTDSLRRQGVTRTRSMPTMIAAREMRSFTVMASNVAWAHKKHQWPQEAPM